jgi:hypothetical protein
VVAVKPRREFEPFFRLNYEEFLDIEGQRSRRVELYGEQQLHIVLMVSLSTSFFTRAFSFSRSSSFLPWSARIPPYRGL